MSEAAVTPEVASITPRRKVNGAAGPVVVKGPAPWTVEDVVSSGQATVSIEIKGRRLGVTYNPNQMSRRESRELVKQADEEDNEWLVTFLSRLLVSWEVVKDGDMYPTSVSALEELPAPFLLAVLRGIQEDINPPEPATSSGSF